MYVLDSMEEKEEWGEKTEQNAVNSISASSVIETWTALYFEILQLKTLN